MLDVDLRLAREVAPAGARSVTVAVMPALFAGHGSPTFALEDNAWRRRWVSVASSLPLSEAILCVSANWGAMGQLRVGSSAQPPTFHDFSCFAPALHRLRYPAPGAPAVAAGVHELTRAALDADRGLDDGCWSVLCAMIPYANVPVL